MDRGNGQPTARETICWLLNRAGIFRTHEELKILILKTNQEIVNELRRWALSGNSSGGIQLLPSVNGDPLPRRECMSCHLKTVKSHKQGKAQAYGGNLLLMSS